MTAKARPQPGPAPKPGRPPSRRKIDAAEAALRDARKRHEAKVAELEAQREVVERKLGALRAKHDKEISRLERARDAAREAYREALEEWSG